MYFKSTLSAGALPAASHKKAKTMSYELNLGPERRERNAKNGQWLPGHKSPLKGRPRSEWMDPETDLRLRERTAKQFREQKHPANCGTPKKPIVAVFCNGEFVVFPSICEAARQTGFSSQNIGRCVQLNHAAERHTDHRVAGVRFYAEADDCWLEKIKIR